MKLMNLLLILTLIVVLKAQYEDIVFNCKDFAPKEYENNTDVKNAYSLDFCRATKFESPIRKCCFIKYEVEEKRQYHCFPVDDEDLADIDLTIDAFESLANADVTSLDCYSKYLLSSFLVILAFLF